MFLSFNQSQVIRLKGMATSLGTTQVGVVKQALSLLEVVSREKKEGQDLCITQDGKVVKNIIIPTFFLN